MTRKQLVTTWFANIDGQNFKANKGLMAENHRFHNPLTPNPVGAEEHIGMMQMMTASFEGKHSINQAVKETGWVTVHGTWSGKHIGEFQGVPTTGNSVTFTWADFFKVIDGEVVNEYFEMNPMAIMEQLETVPS